MKKSMIAGEIVEDYFSYLDLLAIWSVFDFVWCGSIILFSFPYETIIVSTLF